MSYARTEKRMQPCGIGKGKEWCDSGEVDGTPKNLTAEAAK